MVRGGYAVRSIQMNDRNCQDSQVEWLPVSYQDAFHEKPGRFTRYVWYVVRWYNVFLSPSHLVRTALVSANKVAVIPHIIPSCGSNEQVCICKLWGSLKCAASPGQKFLTSILAPLPDCHLCVKCEIQS